MPLSSSGPGSSFKIRKASSSSVSSIIFSRRIRSRFRLSSFSSFVSAPSGFRKAGSSFSPAPALKASLLRKALYWSRTCFLLLSCSSFDSPGSESASSARCTSLRALLSWTFSYRWRRDSCRNSSSSPAGVSSVISASTASSSSRRRSLASETPCRVRPYFASSASVRRCASRALSVFRKMSFLYFDAALRRLFIMMRRFTASGRLSQLLCSDGDRDSIASSISSVMKNSPDSYSSRWPVSRK